MIEPLPPGSSPIVVVLERLQWRVDRNGIGWAAMCPAHEDRIPMLTIIETDDGFVHLFCEERCTFNALLAALDLQRSDLIRRTDAEPVDRLARGLHCRSSRASCSRSK